MPKVSRAHLLEERSMPWSGELLIPRSERELRRSEGSGKLIDDPLVEGSNAGSTNRASDLLQSSGGVKLTEGTVSTDLLVAYTPPFFFFFGPSIYGTRDRGPRYKPGL